MPSAFRISSASVAIALLVVFASPASAQFGGLKDKVKNKLKDKGKQQVQQAASKPDSTQQEGQAPEGGGASTAGGAAAAGAAQGTATQGEEMKLYAKYDFIPGDKVIYFDDLAREEAGEFPSRWGLEDGVFEVAKQGDQNWIWCSDEGTIYPKIAMGPLPEKYTVELQFFAQKKDDGWLELHWVDGEKKSLGHVTLAYDYMTSLKIANKELASKNIDRLPAGKHTMRIMATKTTVKCYIDQERIANVPAIEGFAPVGFAVRMDPYFSDHDPMLIGTFRYAEGGKTLRQQLDEAGKIVTHGILFDSGSDKIRGESYKTLADIGGLLTEDAALRLSIEGHTDSDGADDSNMTLSQKRAAAVRAYLMETYKVDGGRLEAKGWGETKPVDTNDTAEGKATNRRVELVKL